MPLDWSEASFGFWESFLFVAQTQRWVGKGGGMGLWLEFEHDWETNGRQAEVLNECQIGPGRSSLFFCQPDTSQALTKWQAFHRSHGPLYEPAKIAKDMPEWSVLWPQLGAEKLRGRWSAWVHGNDVRPQSETHVRFEWDNEEGVHNINAGEIQATLFIYLFIIGRVLNVEQCFCAVESSQFTIWQALFHA